MTSWIFGYGSLVWRPDMPVLETRRATLPGFVRRFWQGSPDHRGTPSAPGRVVTLVPASGEHVVGVVYRVAPEVLSRVVQALDHREKAGYQRFVGQVSTRRGAVDALVYYAAEGNPSWLGPASLESMAAHIASAEGPSGPNREYLLRLAEALVGWQVHDAHVASLAAAVRGLDDVMAQR